MPSGGLTTAGLQDCSTIGNAVAGAAALLHTMVWIPIAAWRIDVWNRRRCCWLYVRRPDQPLDQILNSARF
jgi:hypothetical protein